MHVRLLKQLWRSIHTKGAQTNNGKKAHKLKDKTVQGRRYIQHACGCTWDLGVTLAIDTRRGKIYEKTQRANNSGTRCGSILDLGAAAAINTHQGKTNEQQQNRKPFYHYVPKYKKHFNIKFLLKTVPIYRDRVVCGSEVSLGLTFYHSASSVKCKINKN